MCVGLPMTVRENQGGFALCAPYGEEDGAGTPVDLALVPEARKGDHLLVFLGLARAVLTPVEAARIRDALNAVAQLATGAADGNAIVASGFADLFSTPPSLPPHLEAARAAGLEQA